MNRDRANAEKSIKIHRPELQKVLKTFDEMEFLIIQGAAAKFYEKPDKEVKKLFRKAHEKRVEIINKVLDYSENALIHFLNENMGNSPEKGVLDAIKMHIDDTVARDGE